MSVELPDSYESIYQRAMVQMATGNSAEAIESLQRIISRLCRLRPETLKRKANLQDTLDAASEAAFEFLRWEQRYDQAISVVESAIDRLSDPDRIHRRIASLTIEKGEVDEGLSRLREIAEANQDFNSWADLGAEYRVLKQYDQAEACYRSALRQALSNQEAAMANLALLSVYQDGGRVDDALDAWDMAVVLNPDLADGVFQTYSWLIRRGDFDLAQKYLDRERRPIRRQFYEGLLDWQKGNKDTARQTWQGILDVEGKIEDPDLTAWVEAALRLDEPAKADARLTELASANQPVPAGVITLYGIAKLMQGEVEQAIEQFDQVVARLRRGWPSRHKIPADRWVLLTSLVPDRARQERVKGCFDTSESGD
jgi:tetratricopeptide (TPR) repeat protein